MVRAIRRVLAGKGGRMDEKTGGRKLVWIAIISPAHSHRCDREKNYYVPQSPQAGNIIPAWRGGVCPRESRDEILMDFILTDYI